jgi:hypothetical protein
MLVSFSIKYNSRWQKEKVQKDKQRSTKHTHKTKDRVTRTPLKHGVNSGDPEEWAVPVPLVNFHLGCRLTML